MAQKSKWTMNRISLMVGVPLLLAFVYVALSSKPATTKPAPVIPEFRVIGQTEDKKAGTWEVELSWSTQNADEVTIEPEIGKVEPDGTKKVVLAGSKSYTLKAVNPGAKAERILEIEFPAK